MAREEDGSEIETTHDPTETRAENGQELLFDELEKQRYITPRSSEVRAKIQKLPNSIKLQGNQIQKKQYYTPREISIGPIHAGNEKLAKRDIKLLMAARFVKGSGKSKRELVGLVKAELEAIKECYEESVFKPFNDDGLLILFFLDACFVLQFIRYNPGELVKLGISYTLQNSIKQDMFLLENQLPMHLLNIFIDSSLMTMVHGSRRDIADEFQVSESGFQEMEEPKGLAFVSPKGETCSLIRMVHDYCSSMAYDMISPTNFKYLRVDYRKRRNERDWLLFHVKKKPAVHLLDVLRTILSLPLKNSIKQSFSLESSRSFRNVQDLKTAGIKVKPSKGATLSDVSFSSSWLFNATLRLPPLTVHRSTVTRLLNLVAYEMCPGNEGCDFEVSSYLWLMDSLVDTEQDVRDLRETHVLRNRFGSDEEVARLFNKIGSNLVVPTNAYGPVQRQIQDHYYRRNKSWVIVVFVVVSKLARWRTQFYEDYFSSPWKVVALMVGALVLFFSGVSAYFAAFPPQQGK